MTITAVIGNYNGEPFLTDCIESLRAQTAQTEILLVDGASTDGSVVLAERLGVRCLLRENLGLGYLYNEGAAASEAEYVFFANNDIAAEPDCLERLLEVLAGDPSGFAADARQLDWAGTRTIHAATTLRRGRMLREHLPGFHLDPNVPADTIRTTLCANGAAMLVRCSLFETLGGFDKTFFMEWEDLDLCWRAWLRGWRTLYVPGAVVRHRVGAVTGPAVRPRRSASSHHNLVRFALKCLPRGAAGRLVLGELLRLPAHPRAVAAGLGRAGRELPEILRERRRIRPSGKLLRSMLGEQA